MKTQQFQFLEGAWKSPLPNNSKANLVMAFGARSPMQDSKFSQTLRDAFPEAHIVGCTTSGEILGTEIFDQSLVVTAVEFKHTCIDSQSVNLSEVANVTEAAKKLADGLTKEGLKHVLVFSDGQQVNGTELVNGLTANLPKGVLVTGGLAGDDARFEETIVWHNGEACSGKIAVCGFYGDKIQIGHGSLGGWDTFGPDRLITKSENNILYELDNQSALSLYKKYLGEFAEQLPASALRFPLSVRAADAKESTVRTILNIDEENESLIFAGDMPEGAYAKLMRANFDRLIDGAQDAATQSLQKLAGSKPQLALLISCVGRRLVLKQETECELESIEDVFSEMCPLCGFYSYGEISPLLESQVCALHNQTMTITTFSEPD